MASRKQGLGAHENSVGRLVSLPHGKAHLIGTGPVTIGRGPSSDIPVHSEDVSRSHAYLMRTPQGFLLVDSSLHGTYVNGERVQAQRLLTEGDVLQIGDRSFRFDLRAIEPIGDPAQLTSELSETRRYPGRVSLRPRAARNLRLALATLSSRIGTWIRLPDRTGDDR